MTPRTALSILPILALPAVIVGAIRSCGRQDVSPEFSDRERFDIVRYWAGSGRYATGAVDDPKGAWKVRLTPDGSQWLWQYNRARGIAKTPPGSTPPPQNAQQRVWETWINARVASDRWISACAAARRNNVAEPPPVPDPGAAPIDLVTLAGDPPSFAACVRPNWHEIAFEDERFRYVDNVEMRPRYAYYRFESGVQSAGTAMKSLPKGELDDLLKRAGISASEARVFRAVSLLEGGFDSVNTYDTGFVSVGFIQFASLAQGGHSLGSVLLRMKADDAGAFGDDFRRYGVDVDPDGTLAVVEPVGGEIVRGPLANAAIIEDKRLIAVFGRAGRRAAFRTAQLRAAKTLYYPGDDKVTVRSGGRVITGKVREIARSEALMAALMDRKVNTGNIAVLGERLALLMSERPEIKKFSDFAPYEAQLLDAVWFRVDTRDDKTLSQPETTRDRDRSSSLSRSGGRGKRRG